MKHSARIVLIALGVLLGLCLIAGGISAIGNRNLLAEYGFDGAAGAAPEHLTPLDKARLAETLHLKDTLGDQVWAGWGHAEIPIILWTGGYEFLTGMHEPPAGWELVAGDAFEGQPYYRRQSDDPQNFAVHVGDRWAASMATKQESDRFLIGTFRDMLPGPLRATFPYRALILPSEAQMAGVLHETFHAYQAVAASERLDAAERAHRLGEPYWEADPAMRDAWAREVELLIRALRAEAEGEARGLAGQFLAQRAQRRKAAGLPDELADYERHLEWEEGLAKYVELAIWRQASVATGYEPLSAVTSDPYFGGYRGFQRRFEQELSAMRRSATREGETRFYYTGMAEAMLLARLAPGWQEHILDDGAWLEDWLSEASTRSGTIVPHTPSSSGRISSSHSH